ncbi:MAG TPA: DUF3626 domain-containing protein [Micromonosporaceae bacterium]
MDRGVGLAAHLAAVHATDRIHAALLGRATRSVVRNPAQWAAFGAPTEVLQQLKYLWHILVLPGEPL